MLKLKFQYFGHLMQRADSLEKTLMLGKIGDRRRRGTTEDEKVGWYHRFNGLELGQTLGACSNSCPSSRWCHPTISSSVIPFSSHLQSFPASGSFQMCQLFSSGGQSIGTSVSTSVFLMNIQDWFPLQLTGLISSKSRGLSRVFSNTTVQKHPVFSAQLSYSPILTSIHDYSRNHSFC